MLFLITSAHTGWGVWPGKWPVVDMKSLWLKSTHSNNNIHELVIVHYIDIETKCCRFGLTNIEFEDKNAKNPPIKILILDKM